MAKLQLERQVVGMVQTNCYLLINEDTRETIVIDPGDNGKGLIEFMNEKNAKPVAIFLTHGHFDHILAVEELVAHYQIPVCAGEAEAGLLLDATWNLSSQFGRNVVIKLDRVFQDGEQFEMAGFDIQALATPGHTLGGVCYYIPAQEVLFSGDSLFLESIGRTDFKGGSQAELVRSVRSLVDKLPEATKVYPGHDDETSIGHEKQFNMFL